MKKTVSDQNVQKKLSKFETDMGGVFTTSDLYHLMGAQNPIANQRALKRFETGAVLERVRRGVYVAENFDAFRLVSVLFPEAYVSLDTVLNAAGLVNTIRPKRISIVTFRRKTGAVRARDMTIDVYSLSKELYFGFERDSDGVLKACPEKAFLDLLYFHTRGYTFLFDPVSEVDTDRLDQKRIERFLKKYRNPKFVKFVKGVLNG